MNTDITLTFCNYFFRSAVLKNFTTTLAEGNSSDLLRVRFTGTFLLAAVSRWRKVVCVVETTSYGIVNNWSLANKRWPLWSEIREK